MQNTNSLNYYECAIVGTSQIFTYQTNKIFNLFDIVLVPLKNTQKQAIILKKTSKPSYNCKDILSLIYSPTNKFNKLNFFICRHIY